MQIVALEPSLAFVSSRVSSAPRMRLHDESGDALQFTQKLAALAAARRASSSATGHAGGRA